MVAVKHDLKMHGLPQTFQRTFVPAGQDPIVALQKLLQLDVTSLGLSVQLSKSGRLEAIALSANNAVVLIDINKYHSKTLRSIASVLHDDSRPLCAFSMARLALYIRDGIGLDVLGVDLSTLRSEFTRKPDSPAQSIEALSPDVDGFAINALWDDSMCVKDHKSLAIRAWLSGL